MEPDEAMTPWTRHPNLVDRVPWTPGRRVASWIWALAPIYTLGIANAAVFLFAAVRKRGWRWWLAAGAYAALTVTIFSISGGPDDSTQDNIYTALIMTNWIVGAGHALAVRRRVFEPESITDLTNVPMIAAAVSAQERRELARQILAQDPKLASDLAIGRPDLNSGYDDGGLVDANSAPATVLAGVPGLTPPLAERIVAARQATSGFTSLDEMIVLADLPPTAIDAARDRLVLSPR